MSFEYENTRRVCYDFKNEGTAYFLPVCMNCGRYVKMDNEIYWSYDNGLKDLPNATCNKCGRIKIDCEMIY